MFRNKRGNKMTDEEKAEEYAENEQCAYCSNPQYCQGKDECYDFANVKSHFLAGLEAGKDMAEADLATIAYMQGAERYKTKYNERLIKAKELIEELSSSLSVVGECEEEECELLNRAEQFLRENE